MQRVGRLPVTVPLRPFLVISAPTMLVQLGTRMDITSRGWLRSYELGSGAETEYSGETNETGSTYAIYIRVAGQT